MMGGVECSNFWSLELRDCYSRAIRFSDDYGRAVHMFRKLGFFAVVVGLLAFVYRKAKGFMTGEDSDLPE